MILKPVQDNIFPSSHQHNEAVFLFNRLSFSAAFPAQPETLLISPLKINYSLLSRSSQARIHFPHASLAYIYSSFSKFFVFFIHVTIFHEVETRFLLVDILGHLELVGFPETSLTRDSNIPFLWLFLPEGLQAT